jgi:hypothetical protein
MFQADQDFGRWVITHCSNRAEIRAAILDTIKRDDPLSDAAAAIIEHIRRQPQSRADKTWLSAIDAVDGRRDLF